MGIVLILANGSYPGHAQGLRGQGQGQGMDPAIATVEQTPGKKLTKKERSLQAINPGIVTVGITGMTGGTGLGSLQPTAHPSPGVLPVGDPSTLAPPIVPPPPGQYTSSAPYPTYVLVPLHPLSSFL